jgi:hypothetical protein
LLNEFLQLWGEGGGDGIISWDYFSIEFWGIGIVEWEIAADDGIEGYSCTPDID